MSSACLVDVEKSMTRTKTVSLICYFNKQLISHSRIIRGKKILVVGNTVGKICKLRGHLLVQPDDRVLRPECKVRIG